MTRDTALRQIVEHWRDLREKAAEVGLAYAGKHRGYEAAGCCEALERCADELAALLAGERSPQTGETIESRSPDGDGQQRQAQTAEVLKAETGRAESPQGSAPNADRSLPKAGSEPADSRRKLLTILAEHARHSGSFNMTAEVADLVLSVVVGEPPAVSPESTRERHHFPVGICGCRYAEGTEPGDGRTCINPDHQFVVATQELK